MAQGALILDRYEPLGIGTILSVALAGPILQLICNMTHFNAADVVHQNLLKSLQILLGKA